MSRWLAACWSPSATCRCCAALVRVLADLEPHKPKGYDVEAIRPEHPAAYTKWTPEEERRLLDEHDRGRIPDDRPAASDR